jgi:lysophospholipase L1-like esterase
LALLIGGGFLISQNVENVKATTSYTEVYASDFANDTNISDWIEVEKTGTPTWQVKVNGNLGGSFWGWNPNASALLRPDNISNGKIVFESELGAYSGAPTAIARYKDASSPYYAAWKLSSGGIKIMRHTGSLVGLLDNSVAIGQAEFACDTSLTNIRYEFEVQDVANDNTKLTVNVYDLNDNGNLKCSATVTDTGTTLPTGRWGITSLNVPEFSSIKLYQASSGVDLYIPNTTDNIKFGDTITYTVSDDEAQTVTFTDNGTGGTFSPSATVDLTLDNSFTATVIYTPSKAGNVSIEATSSTHTTFQFQDDVFVSPYSPVIGYIGDSITFGDGGYPPVVPNTTNDLGAGFSAVNEGVDGATTASYLADDLTSAISAFNGAGVEVVHIMLGTNDSKASESITPTDYKNNMQQIIDQLKTAGVKNVIVSYPAIAFLNDESTPIAKLQSFIAVIPELVSENDGFVRLGDTQAYDYFQNTPTALFDKVHPNATGHAALGGFWANAIRADLEYEIDPDATWVSSDNEFTLNEDGTLALSIDKYIDEFTGVVKVTDGDNVSETLTENTDFTATAGSTVIELLNTYLNTLGAGTYTLSVEFSGGVWVESTFTISASGVITPTPISPNAPALPSVPNTGFNLGKFVSENRGAVLSALVAVIAGLGISVVLVGRKLAKEI